jgi:uncharacterized protein (DUF488 family)
LGAFVSLIAEFPISQVVDIRTQPYSTRLPHFNSPTLEEALGRLAIKYYYLGSELGARWTDPNVLSDTGQVWYTKVFQMPQYQRGMAELERLITGSRGLVIMCAEGHPLDCHRFPMVARPLHIEGYQVEHIMPNGDLRSHIVVENELLQRFQSALPHDDLFTGPQDESSQLDHAYDALNRKIGWRPGETHQS